MIFADRRRRKGWLPTRHNNGLAYHQHSQLQYYEEVMARRASQLIAARFLKLLMLPLY